MSKRKAWEEVDMREEDPRDPKRVRICPVRPGSSTIMQRILNQDSPDQRDILGFLSRWRVQPDKISFTEESPRKQGATADVRRATLRLAGDTTYVAIKSFRLDDNGDDNRVLATLAHEIRLLSKLRHHNVIQLKGFVEDTTKDIAWIILPWEANGNMREFLHLEAWEIPERVSLIYDIACGVEYLHTQDPPIRHGDLKPANILVNSQNRAVITDFGSARLLGEPTLPEVRVQKATMIPSEPLPDKQATAAPRAELKLCGTLITLTGTAWTLRWAAPELVNDENPGLWSDIWAFSWICWEASYSSLEILSRRAPY
ncbi:hypothetical protein FRC04_009031 [Tulasnella sp. 424]|nr:hypothetical protein FRC04_009031 [Tulasnella sp. 424]